MAFTNATPSELLTVSNQDMRGFNRITGFAPYLRQTDILMQRHILCNPASIGASVLQTRTIQRGKFNVTAADRLPFHQHLHRRTIRSLRTHSSMTTPTPIHASDLRTWLLSKTTAVEENTRHDVPKTFKIVDVRDDDYQGGNIPGAINVPSRQLSYRVDDLVDELKGTEAVVFTCALSQQR